MSAQSILVLREPDHFGELLKLNGLTVIDLSLIATRPVSDLSDLEKRLASLSDYDGMFFTSPVAAGIFVKALEKRNLVFPGKIYVLGERTKEIFEKAGMEVEYREKANTAREFLTSFPDDEFAGNSYLFVRGERSMNTVPELIGEVAKVDESVVYQTYDLEPAGERLDEIHAGFKNGEIDWVCFFSPSQVDSFLRIFRLSELNGIRTAAIGETTAERIKQAGLPVNLISTKASATAFAAELIDQIKIN